MNLFYFWQSNKNSRQSMDRRTVSERTKTAKQPNSQKSAYSQPPKPLKGGLGGWLVGTIEEKNLFNISIELVF